MTMHLFWGPTGGFGINRGKEKGKFCMDDLSGPL